MSDLSNTAIGDFPIRTRQKRPRLKALTGIRFFAALHLFLFHVKQAHDVGFLRFPLLDRLPGPIAAFLDVGYISTGLFFILSGFVLAYVYLDDDGRLQTTAREFVTKRLRRLYPLYFVSLLLLAPAPMLLPKITNDLVPQQNLFAVVAANLTLTQSWFPNLALSWNAPAWALSAMLTYYIAFPFLSKRLSGRGQSQLRTIAITLTALGLLPALLYWWFDPTGDALTASPSTLGKSWFNALRFGPVTWLPQFVLGVVLGRLFVLDLLRSRTPQPSTRRVCVGDFAALSILALAISKTVPYLFLRHGLLAPLFVVVVFDLARERGLFARLFAANWIQPLGETGFALFALQMPVGLWIRVLVVSDGVGTDLQYLLMIATTLGVSWLATRWMKGAPVLSMRSASARPTSARFATSELNGPVAADS